MNRFQHAGQAFSRLCELMAQLRAPGGCPWDREQTLDTLRSYLLEETYETLDAMENGTSTEHREELGDLLLQIVFQAELTQETGDFGAAEVCETISEKLVRRHPHVFGEVTADDAAGALESWEKQKTKEKPGRSRLAGVPKTLPALLRAYRVGEKASAAGFDWPDAGGVRAKVLEEWTELEEAEEPDREEELGDLLFAIANLARHWRIDPENALRKAIGKFSKRFSVVEAELKARGDSAEQMSIDDLERLWQYAKSREGAGGA